MFTFISGATGGLGKAYAEYCAKSGYDLFLTARNPERLSELRRELLTKYNVRIEYFPCQLTDDASRE